MLERLARDKPSVTKTKCIITLRPGGSINPRMLLNFYVVKTYKFPIIQQTLKKYDLKIYSSLEFFDVCLGKVLKSHILFKRL
jgi:hypothetical protein